MIREENLRRVETDQDIAERNGFNLKRTLYPLGTDVLQIGIDNYKKSRKEYEELPDVEEAVANIVSVIQKEDRQDAEFQLNRTRMIGTGAVLSVEDDEGYIRLMPTSWSLKQIIERSRPQEKLSEAVTKAATYASDPFCPSHFRKDITNYYLSGAVDAKKSAIKATYRTRLIEENDDYDRELFAVVSNRYNTHCDTDNLARMVGRRVEESGIPARVEALYDRRRFTMSVLYHSDVETPVVGELFKAGVIIDSADDGSRGISITPMVMRNLCLNFIILDKATQTVSLTHLRSNLYDRVSVAINLAMQKVAEFGERWAAASKEKIIDSIYHDAEPQRVFEQLVKQGLVKIPGTNKNELVLKLVQAWEKEPGYQKTNIVNALTRAAHESSWGSPWIGAELEEQAGRLLYNKLFVDLSNE